MGRHVVQVMKYDKSEGKIGQWGHREYLNLKPHLHQKSIVDKKVCNSNNNSTWLGSMISPKEIGSIPLVNKESENIST